MLSFVVNSHFRVPRGRRWVNTALNIKFKFAAKLSTLEPYNILQANRKPTLFYRYVRSKSHFKTQYDVRGIFGEKNAVFACIFRVFSEKRKTVLGSADKIEEGPLGNHYANFGALVEK